MRSITPKAASDLARRIYDIQNEYELLFLLNDPMFSSSKPNKSVLKAELGGRSNIFFRAKDTFGIIAHGAKGSKYENDMFLIFRGTNPNKSADIITDARIGLQMSKTGAPVHIGFNEAFKSMLPKIQTFILESGKHVNTFHCIGHSLGGAVATLAADWIKSATGKPVKAYTFGAPKVGLNLFATNYTRKMKKDSIYRVFNATDPVPIIPLYPYIHAPLYSFGHSIPSSESNLSVESHDIEKYWLAVRDKDWGMLQRRKPLFTIEVAVEQFLKSRMPVNENTPKIWEWLNAAIIYVLKKVASAALITLQTIIMTVHSVIDFIVFLFQKILALKDALGEWVLWLIQKINQVLRIRVPETVEDLTREGIRRSLRRLHEKANEEARKAIFRIR